MNFKTLGSALLLVALVGGLLAASPGGVAAADVQLSNSTMTVDDGTDSAYAEINNTATGDTNVTVEYIGVESDGTETQIASNNVVATGGSETLDEQQVDETTYDEVRVSTTFNDTNANASDLSVTYGTFQMVDGGGGGGFDLGGLSTLQVVLILAVGGMVLMVKD